MTRFPSVLIPHPARMHNDITWEVEDCHGTNVKGKLYREHLKNNHSWQERNHQILKDLKASTTSRCNASKKVSRMPRGQRQYRNRQPHQRAMQAPCIDVAEAGTCYPNLLAATTANAPMTGDTFTGNSFYIFT